tara:strand:- start:102 stop:335 length:234 start_codon:yes stop_codon:yes gene_type:complete
MKYKLKRNKSYSLILNARLIYYDINEDNKKYKKNLLKYLDYLIEKEILYTQREIIDQKLKELDNKYYLYINNNLYFN